MALLLLSTALFSAAIGFAVSRFWPSKSTDAEVLSSHAPHNIEAIKYLGRLTKELRKTKGFKVRAQSHPKSELEPLIQTINQMLEQLQDNENEIQDMAVSLQEQSDTLASQKKLHKDRDANLQKMFAGASHDLRQPLQAMVIFVAAIKETASSEQMPLVKKLEQVVDNLDQMFSDLLDLSKLESRIKRIPKQRVDIHPLLSNIYDEFEALANDKKIELRLFNRNLSVYSNANMLERIIRNMISNAIRYTRTGGVLIGIRERGQEVWIEVWDTGRGIPQEKMSEIFNEFVQIKDSQSESNHGVGLGLFIVKRLAQLLDHSIIVKSKIHQGTLFRVAVPMHNAKISQASNLFPLHDTDTQPTTPINITHLIPNKSLIVAIIDDDATIRMSLKALLESWDLSVLDMGSIAEAKSLIPTLENKIDLVLSDFQLSEYETGIDAITVFRSYYGEKLPAILITGTTDSAVLERARNSGIPLLRKPVKPAKLRALINTLARKA